MPSPNDLRRFRGGRPIQDYLSQTHLNAVLEAMSVVTARGTDRSAGVHSAIGRLTASAPELLDRDIVVYNNTAVFTQLNPDGTFLRDVPIAYRQFDLVPLGPPEEDPRNEVDGERISSGYITYTSLDEGQASKQNIIGYAIALHDTPACSPGLALLAGHTPVFTTDATEDADDEFRAARSQTVEELDEDYGFSEHESAFDTRSRQKHHDYTFYGYPSNDTGTCAGTCHYTCGQHPVDPELGLYWNPGFGSCSPNCYCPDLGSCTSAGATNSSACVTVENHQAHTYSSGTRTRNIGIAHLESNTINQYSMTGLTLCTNRYTGTWEWIPIGEECSKTEGCIVNNERLPECTADLCGKYRSVYCECIETTTTVPPSTTTTTPPPTTTTTACPIDPNSGNCGCAEYQCVPGADGETFWKLTGYRERQSAVCCCDQNLPGPCTDGDTQIVACSDPAVIGCAGGSCTYVVAEGCPSSPYSPPTTAMPWPLRPVRWSQESGCCPGSCSSGFTYDPETLNIRPVSGCFSPWYRPFDCQVGSVLDGFPGGTANNYYGEGGGSIVYDGPHQRPCENPCGEGGISTPGYMGYGNVPYGNSQCAFLWKGGWQLVPGVYKNSSGGYDLGDTCAGDTGISHCVPPPAPDIEPLEGTINFGICCRPAS